MYMVYKTHWITCLAPPVSASDIIVQPRVEKLLSLCFSQIELQIVFLWDSISEAVSVIGLLHSKFKFWLTALMTLICLNRRLTSHQLSPAVQCCYYSRYWGMLCRVFRITSALFKFLLMKCQYLNDNQIAESYVNQ